ncbi:MAG: hypothetical protein NC393_08765 [Clostridium sp.]|nr:hypothetical protein [Clostridium sp.]MCM1172202.1 hypothetical protein [Clostridium sp.]MCM1208111.1 hypothetical protein [Ruminococcus sp.]
MESIKTVEEFKKFMEDNHDMIYSNAVDADKITLNDEWMQDDKWEEIYHKGVSGNQKF